LRVGRTWLKVFIVKLIWEWPSTSIATRGTTFWTRGRGPDRIKSPLLCQLSYAGRLFDLRD
jgi:hypothetical protein